MKTETFQAESDRGEMHKGWRTHSVNMEQSVLLEQRTGKEEIGGHDVWTMAWGSDNKALEYSV